MVSSKILLRTAGRLIAVHVVTLPASFNLWLSTPEARFLKSKFLWCNWDINELKSRANEIESGRLLNIDLVGWPFGPTAN
jgi:hypothetical protein